MAIGTNAGRNTQGQSSIAIGNSAGLTGQGNAAIAIGKEAGETNQGANAIAIGELAGSTGQGANAIAIGFNAGQTGQTAGSIVINASGTAINGAAAGTYLRPIRISSTVGTAANLLFFNPTTFELIYGATSTTPAATVNTKTFVIDHPKIQTNI